MCSLRHCGSSPAAAEDPAAAGREIIQALGREEAAAPAGRLTLSAADRRGPFKDTELLSETKRRIAAEPAMKSTGTLLFDRTAWLKELTVSLPGSDKPSLRTRTAETGGVLRNLIEPLSEPGAPQAKVIEAPATAPADAILTRRVGRSAEGIVWTAVRRVGDDLTLEGARGDERHEMEILAGAHPEVRHWNLQRRLETPAGEKIDQAYYCDVTPGEAAGSIRRVEEWVVNPAPIRNVSCRSTDVVKAEALPSLPDGALAMRFPAGTQVTDARGEVPVEYVQTEAGVNEADVAEVSKALAGGRARVGDPAPLFELKGPKGKTVRLQDYRGKTVLLFWFSGRSKPSEAAAGFIDRLDDEYRKRGVQVIGIDVLDEAAAEAAEDFRKRFGWKFPVVIDDHGEAMRRYGLETGVPKAAIVGPDGKLEYARAGVDPDAITAVLDRLARK